MIFIGSGADVEKIKVAANEHEWVHYLGSQFNEKKVPFFYISDVFLMPGLVGLAIIDSFIMQSPIVTTDFEYHSPEIEYLENGVNGLMTNNNIADYTSSVVSLLRDTERLARLKVNCSISAKNYPIENMVESFKDGIIKCLET